MFICEELDCVNGEEKRLQIQNNVMFATTFEMVQKEEREWPVLESALNM